MNQILVTEKVIMTPEFKRKRKIYKFHFCLSIFLVCILSSICIYAEYDRNKSEEVSQEILSTIELAESDDSDNTTISVEDDVLIVELLADSTEESTVNVTDLIDEGTTGTTITESVASDGTTYYTEAVLSIPSINIEYPVLSDTSDELLKISLNKLWGPDPNEEGNYVIVGHNYKSGKMFGKLSAISVGDTMTLTDLTGRTITYEVYSKYIVDPTDVSCTSQLTNGRKELTLITCQNSGKQRLIVKATEVN